MSESLFQEPTLFKKETQTQVLFCELCEIFKNIFLQATVSQNMKAYIYDNDRPQLSNKKFFWKYLENIQEHICIGLPVLLSYRSCKTKDWLNPHGD